MILEAVAGSAAPMSLAEASRRTGLHRSTAFHLLQTLVGLGFLRRIDATRRYELATRLHRLTQPNWTFGQLGETAAPVLAQLAKRSGEGAALAAFRGASLTVVAKHESDAPVRVMQEVGTLRPPHASAAGKVILAWLAAPECADRLARMEFIRLTPRTITDRAAFEAELQRVRQAGCAIDDEEHMVGIRCISAPVFAQAGHVIAGLTIIGPTGHMTRRKLRALRAPLLELARELSERLGWLPDDPRDAGTNAA